MPGLSASLSALRETVGAALHANPVMPADLPPVHVPEPDGPLATLADPAKFVGEQAMDVMASVLEDGAQDAAQPDRQPPTPDGDPYEPGRQPFGDPLGPDDGSPHWTVDPFAPEVVLDGDPIDLNTGADLANLAHLPGLPDGDDVGLGDALV